MQIGIVEDEVDLRNIMKGYLEKEGYQVQAYESAEQAKDSIQAMQLWIVDIMLPGQNGIEFVEYIKRMMPHIPVIFVSARDQSFDRILGLEKGAEDYVTKPFVAKELVLRVKKILERCYQKKDTVDLLGYHIDLTTHKVYEGEELLELSNREYKLLILLVQHIGKPFTRDEILNQVWEPGYFGSDRVVDDLVRRLRKKMPHLCMQTIYGYGYRLEKD